MTKTKEQNQSVKQKFNLLERERRRTTIDTVRLLATKMGITLSERLSRPRITYFVIPQKTEIENETHTTYGIGAIHNGVLIAEIRDISTNYNKIKNLVYLCNDGNLSPIHLRDVVEDFLAE